MTPQVGDIVMYVPECVGDMCAHEPIHARPAIVTHVSGETVDLTVFHPRATAHLQDRRHGGPGQLGTWYPRGAS